MTDAVLLDRARGGDESAFATLVGPHRRELQRHCYRILGSLADAEDATQEALMAAWRGIAGFAGHSSLRTWLYRIATRTSLRIAERRPARLLSWDAHPARDPLGDLGAADDATAWLEPWIASADDPAEAAERRDAISLAFLAALQQLPPGQRAVLILRDVLDFSAAETAEALETSVAAVNSALQRARASRAGAEAAADRGTVRNPAQQRVVDAFVAAFEAGDVPGIVGLLTEDVRLTMPPLPAWFDGIADVAAFFAERSLVTPWRVREHVLVNGMPALVADQQTDGVWRPGAVMALGFRGSEISWIASFLDPRVIERAGSER
ncbi:RNA polymerase subunit sigma-70 [Microbacterium azadirachtae]|uniref:RNA polymerase subunit sigma-70 n=1 Tax=Microbacterium azadirachtae TaxID=582680 RepID=UPI00088FE99F|nr:RNA polymerase subunit sigma-70 [Microbacterium azadirachtae]SDL61804.1 RNA polymerase sigma-70 factor, ECF subfamily [Microbacterium azadirachtae]SEF90689.1 RNA polymerase sigma-70 factor, ECF subfamily [Microbacterium azadirachtae]SEF92590.1 RNA polymerase sigma-70 factor, ECF subfamily [Microbacterium azadirachtae]